MRRKKDLNHMLPRHRCKDDDHFRRLTCPSTKINRRPFHHRHRHHHRTLTVHRHWSRHHHLLLFDHRHDSLVSRATQCEAMLDVCWCWRRTVYGHRFNVPVWLRPCCRWQCTDALWAVFIDFLAGHIQPSPFRSCLPSIGQGCWYANRYTC